MSSYPRSLRIALVSAFAIVPLALLAFLAVSAPPDQALQRLAPLVTPYLIGTLVGLGFVAYSTVIGKLSAPLPRGANRTIFVVVSSISVPTAILLPLLFRGDPRLTIAMLGLGFMLPIVPVVVDQIAHHVGD